MSLDFYLDHLESKGWGKPVTSKEENVLGEQHVDRDHHVPLLASALMDGSGGIAIDHRADIPKEYEKYLMLHEDTELKHMQNLIKTGMSPQKAYEKAHDNIATPIEHAAVEADLGKEGLEKYKKHMREQATVAAEPSDKERHPDAHTTRFNLDSEMAKKYETVKQLYPLSVESDVKGMTAEQLEEEAQKKANEGGSAIKYQAEKWQGFQSRFPKDVINKEELEKVFIHRPGYDKMPERWKDNRDIRID